MEVNSGAFCSPFFKGYKDEELEEKGVFEKSQRWNPSGSGSVQLYVRSSINWRPASRGKDFDANCEKKESKFENEECYETRFLRCVLEQLRNN